MSLLLKYADPWLGVGICALMLVALIWVGVAEHSEQQANRTACPGRYVRVGDKRDSGLCIRRDAVIWER